MQHMDHHLTTAKGGCSYTYCRAAHWNSNTGFHRVKHTSAAVCLSVMFSSIMQSYSSFVTSVHLLVKVQY